MKCLRDVKSINGIPDFMWLHFRDYEQMHGSTIVYGILYYKVAYTCYSVWTINSDVLFFI